jgi:hypothetical protein
VKAEPEPEFAALAAIGWADQKHYWSLRTAGQEGLQRGTLDNTPEAVEVWIMALHVRFGGRQLAMALEQRRGALAVMLSNVSARSGRDRVILRAMCSLPMIFKTPMKSKNQRKTPALAA